MEKLKTAKEKEFPCDYFNPFPQSGQVNIRVLNSALAQVAAVFSDPQETMQLFCGDQCLTGFTRLLAIVPEGDAIRVVLGKE